MPLCKCQHTLTNVELQLRKRLEEAEKQRAQRDSVELERSVAVKGLFQQLKGHLNLLEDTDENLGLANQYVALLTDTLRLLDGAMQNYSNHVRECNPFLEADACLQAIHWGGRVLLRPLLHKP